MTHANAPISVEGRRRLIERCQHQPISHVAAQMGISRACASKWVNRWRNEGEQSLEDRMMLRRYDTTICSGHRCNWNFSCTSIANRGFVTNLRDFHRKP